MGVLWGSATARSGVLSTMLQQSPMLPIAFLTPLPPAASAGAWSAGGIEAILPRNKQRKTSRGGMVGKRDASRGVVHSHVAISHSVVSGAVDRRRGQRR